MNPTLTGTMLPRASRPVEGNAIVTVTAVRAAEAAEAAEADVVAEAAAVVTTGAVADMVMAAMAANTERQVSGLSIRS